MSRARPPRHVILLVGLLASWLVGCTPLGVSPPPLSTPLPTVAAHVMEREAVGGLMLVSVEGVRERDMRDWREQSLLPALDSLAERGWLSTLHPPDPTFPESAAATLLTARLPAEHGVVGLPDESLPLAPFWAGQDNLYTVLVGPWSEGMTEADARIGPGTVQVESALHEPVLAPAQVWQEAPPSFSPRLEAVLPLQRGGVAVGELFLLAVDTLNDGVVAYDQYWLATERRVGPDAALLDALKPGWATVSVGAWVAVDLLLVEGRAGSLRLYQSPGWESQLWPDALRQGLRSAVGAYPPEPDIVAFRRGWLSATALGQMAARQSMWLAEATAWLWRATPPGQRPLFLVHWPAPGQLQAELLLVEPDQPGWGAERQASLQAVRRQGLADVDAALAVLLAALDLSRHALFVTSPLGVEAVRHEIGLPLLLQREGIDPALLRVEERGAAVWLQASPETLREVAALLAAASDPASGRQLFERVVAGEKMGGEQAHGWLLVQASAGYAVTGRTTGEALQPALRLGETGGAVTSEDLAGWWAAAGRGVRAGSGEEEVELVAVPREALRLLTEAGRD